MREIKFRAFNKETGKMLSFKQLKAISVLATSRIEGLFIPDDTRMIWMQFVGLMEKNGVEVFEGDIGTDVNDEWYEVKFDNGAFIVIHDGNVIEELSEVADGMGIIGNIYENPDLLKSVDKGIEERS